MALKVEPKTSKKVVKMADEQHESIEFDVLIVGAGPAGLSAAIRLKQKNPDLNVCVLEKGSEVGAHIVSGAVMNPRSLNELIPNWKEKGAPLNTPVGYEDMFFLTETNYHRIPFLDKFGSLFSNKGNYIVSLGEVTRWLAQYAEELGVEIICGFAGSELLLDDDIVVGVRTGAMGINKKGEKTSHYEPGVDVRARYTLLAEGCRGSLSKKAMAHYDLRDGCDPQTYGLGIKEVWKVPKSQHHKGLVQHTVGWPLDSHTYGGGWMYHFGEDLVSYGFVVGLDYVNTWLSPFEEMQRTKWHPVYRKYLHGGKRIMYGARAISEGGLQALPRLTFPGGALIGDCAGFLDVPRIKGIHTSMKSGMLAADAVHLAYSQKRVEPRGYQTAFEQSWLYKELHEVRNFRPAFANHGLYKGMILSGIEAAFGGKTRWTYHFKHSDNEELCAASICQKPLYPKPDNKLTFDRPSSVALSFTNHEEDQPVHLKVGKMSLWRTVNWDVFRAPETRYCPAGVYEVVGTHEEPRLQINAQNCVHCKTCDIKDPTGNIEWCPPQGGGGPNYPVGM